MTKLTLIYFPVRGRAEPIRLMLEELGVAYEDRLVASLADWARLKPETPFGQVPLLDEDGVVISQSQAIIRHLARAHDFYGKSERERTLADIAEEAFAQAEDSYWGPLWQKDSDAAIAAYVAGSLHETHARLERNLVRTGGEYWAGSALTFADFVAFKYLDMMAALHPASLQACPALNAFAARIASRPRVAAYLASGRRPRVIGFSIKGPVLDPRTG